MRACRSEVVICIAVAVLTMVSAAGCGPRRASVPYERQISPVLADIHDVLAAGQPHRLQTSLEDDFAVLARVRPPAGRQAYHRQMQVALTAALDLANADSSWSPGTTPNEDSAAAIADKMLVAKAETSALDKWPASTGRRRVAAREFYRMTRVMLLDEQQPQNDDFNRYVAEPGFDSVVATEKLVGMIAQIQRHRDSMLSIRPPQELEQPYVEVLRAFSHDLEAGKAYKEALVDRDVALARAKATAAEKGWARADELLDSALDRISAAVPGAERLKVSE